MNDKTHGTQGKMDSVFVQEDKENTSESLAACVFKFLCTVVLCR